MIRFISILVALLTIASASASTDITAIFLNEGVLDAFNSTVTLTLPGFGVIHGSMSYTQSGLGFFSFLGIPYAIPPISERRWRAPSDISSSSWPSSTLDATHRQADCVRGAFPPNGSLVGSEDCLYINIFVPATNSSLPVAGFPVVFYIHGGNFQTTDFDFDGFEPVAVSQSFIYVHVYYRVGVFGFLAHPALSAESSPYLQSGNYGLMDQQSALRFVQNNIWAFGGDRNRVTLEGHSAGAWSVCFHLVMPASAGLFHQVILHSGSCEVQSSVAVLTLVQGEALGLQAATTMQCALPALNSSSTSPDYALQLQCLRALPANAAFGPVASSAFMAVVDNVLIPNFPTLLLRGGQFASVPMLIGTTTAELIDFYYFNALPLPPPSSVNWPVVTAVTASFTASRTALAPRVASFYTEAVYQAEFNSSDAVGAMIDVLNDYAIRCPTHRLAMLNAHTQLFNDSSAARVWSYVWQYLPVNLPPVLRTAGLQQAAHGHELPFVFTQPNILTNFVMTPQEQALSAILQNLIARFVISGNPNQPLIDLDLQFAAAYNRALVNHSNIKPYAVPTWPAYSVDSSAAQQLLIIQPDAALAATTTTNSSTGFSNHTASEFFGLRCDAIASAPLPLDNTAQLRLSVCTNLLQVADPCMHRQDPTNICIDHFNNTHTCVCNGAHGFKPTPASLSCVIPADAAQGTGPHGNKAGHTITLSSGFFIAVGMLMLAMGF